MPPTQFSGHTLPSRAAGCKSLVFAVRISCEPPAYRKFRPLETVACQNYPFE